MTAGDDKPRVCFVALNAYGALTGRVDLPHIGGAEMQQALVGRELARRGGAVTFITLDHGQQDGEAINGIRVLKAYAQDSGLPGLRFITPRLTGLWSAIRRADADVYYQRMAEQTTGLVAAFCRRQRRAFIFATASDFDCLPTLPRLHKRRERWLFRYGLRRADRVFAQTCAQQRLLRDGFSVEAVVVPNVGRDLRDELRGTGVPTAAPSDARRRRVLWIGRFTPEKRLEWVVDLARRCPDIVFDVVGGPGDHDDRWRGVQRDAAALANVTLHGRVPHADVTAFYQRSAAVLCTSEREGFPNTFLEAFSLGVPVATTFDPDGVVARHGLGIVAQTPPSLAQALREWLDDPIRLDASGQAARAYFDAHHDVRRVADLYEQELAALCGRARRRALERNQTTVEPSDA